jgi:hypothetical protein
LKLKHDGPLSNFAFECNLRRYTLGTDFNERVLPSIIHETLKVGRCRLPYQTHIESAWKLRLETEL